MAEYLGITASYVAKFKTDARRPNTYQIDKIARKLNVTTDFLLGNEAAGLPYFMDYFGGASQGISLMSGLYYEKNFCIHNKWNTINDIKKDDLLIFARTSNVANGKIALVSFNKKELILGRVQDDLIYFDNGLTPISICDDKYNIEGKLIRIMRYID